MDVYYNKNLRSFLLDNKVVYYYWLTQSKNVLSSTFMYAQGDLMQMGVLKNLVLSFYIPHINILDIVGLGYRIFLTRSLIKLKIGLSHFIYIVLNKHISLKFLSKTKILFYSVFKHKVNSFINYVYQFKFPSKYKRKGFFLNRQFNTLKVGKVFSF